MARLLIVEVIPSTMTWEHCVNTAECRSAAQKQAEQYNRLPLAPQYEL
jgi:hypothetical protein